MYKCDFGIMYLVIGNWKMKVLQLSEAKDLYGKVSEGALEYDGVEAVVCPSFVYLGLLSGGVGLGAQDVFYEEKGSFTGEVSAVSLLDLGVSYVIVGHSERRKMGETNKDVNLKIKRLLSVGITPVVCVGEEDREGDYKEKVKRQTEEVFEGVRDMSGVMVAYEPIWAISDNANGRVCTGENCREMVELMEEVLRERQPKRYIYGGSVNGDNAEEYLREGGVSGLLPGKASLTAESFLEILEVADRVK